MAWDADYDRALLNSLRFERERLERRVASIREDEEVLQRRLESHADEGSRPTPPAETANPGSGQLVEAATPPTSRSTG